MSQTKDKENFKSHYETSTKNKRNHYFGDIMNYIFCNRVHVKVWALRGMGQLLIHFGLNTNTSNTLIGYKSRRQLCVL